MTLGLMVLCVQGNAPYSHYDMDDSRYARNSSRHQVINQTSKVSTNRFTRVQCFVLSLLFYFCMRIIVVILFSQLHQQLERKPNLCRYRLKSQICVIVFNNIDKFKSFLNQFQCLKNSFLSLLFSQCLLTWHKVKSFGYSIKVL